MKWIEWKKLFKLAGEIVLGAFGSLAVGLILILAGIGAMSIYDKLPQYLHRIGH